MTKIATAGTYFGGIATSVAIIWIVFNSVLQSESLKLQSEEVALQRKATQKIAEATELATVIELVRLAEKSIYYDLNFLISKFLDDLENKFADRNPNADPWTSAILSHDFSQWLERKHTTQDIYTLASVSAICRKYELLRTTIQKLSDGNDLEELTLGSSNIAHLYRIVSKFNYITNQTVS